MLQEKAAKFLKPSGSPADVLVGIAISFDMGWQKRERGHNSLTGHWNG